MRGVCLSRCLHSWLWRRERIKREEKSMADPIVRDLKLRVSGSLRELRVTVQRQLSRADGDNGTTTGLSAFLWGQ